MLCQFSQYGGLVAGARSYLKHAVSGTDLRTLKHGSNDVGLRSGLLFGDGNGMVGVSFRPVMLTDEFMARDLAHSRQHPLIMNATAMELLLHHGRTLGQERLLLDLVRTHVHLFRLRIRTSKPRIPFWSLTATIETLLLTLYSTWITCSDVDWVRLVI